MVKQVTKDLLETRVPMDQEASLATRVARGSRALRETPESSVTKVCQSMDAPSFSVDFVCYTAFINKTCFEAGTIVDLSWS